MLLAIASGQSDQTAAVLCDWNTTDKVLNFAEREAADTNASGLFACTSGEPAVLDAESIARHDGQSSSQIVVVDASVPQWESLLAGIASLRNIEIVILDPDRDGIEQISQVLTSHNSVDALSIVSHGSQASLALGSITLDTHNLPLHADQLRTWRNGLSGTADILVYGCNVAAGELGLKFVHRLAALTDADVAASNDRTGAAVLGGDWELEVATGGIEVAQVFSATSAADFSQVLANIQVADGKLSEAPTAGNDVYTFQPNWGTITIDGNVPVPNPDNVEPAPVARAGGHDTFDFNQIGQALKVVVGKSTTTATQGPDSATVTEDFRPHQITGGTVDDVFVIQKGASLASSLDGHSGADLLSYSDPQLPFAGKVSVNLALSR